MYLLVIKFYYILMLATKAQARITYNEKSHSEVPIIRRHSSSRYMYTQRDYTTRNTLARVIIKDKAKLR